MLRDTRIIKWLKRLDDWIFYRAFPEIAALKREREQLDASVLAFCCAELGQHFDSLEEVERELNTRDARRAADDDHE